MRAQPAEPVRKRRYHSPLRRQRAEATRQRIVSAGAELLREFPVWNWNALTVRAVAERAGVSERTIYRHFAGERELRDAVLVHFAEEARVDLEGLRLDGVRAVAVRILQQASSFPLEPRTPRDPSVQDASRRQREALLGAVAPFTADWSEADRQLAAALLDVLWSVPSYERLVADWQLDPQQAIRGVDWAIRLLEEGIRAGARPAADVSGDGDRVGSARARSKGE